MITIQYLEDSPEIKFLSPVTAVQVLRAARDTLPFDRLLIGWNLPAELLEACCKEAQNLGIRVLRWHPLLTSDAVFLTKPDWQVVNPLGDRIPGYKGMPEFTFICPNQPDARQAILKRMERLCKSGFYQGLFLDRIRFPSPSADPVKHLGCFCKHCCREAAKNGLDLAEVRKVILEMTNEEQGRYNFVRVLLNGEEDLSITQNLVLQEFLKFRCQTITFLIKEINQVIRDSRLEIGLDCFSPSFTRMVGQDLSALGKMADWVKLMSYAHTYGPAGIPFELLGIIDYLGKTTDLSYARQKKQLDLGLFFKLPEKRDELEQFGISTNAMVQEVRKGHCSINAHVLAGLELVEIEGVATASNQRLIEDLNALRDLPDTGLAISWDLLHIPLSRLKLVRDHYLGNGFNNGRG
jgi:hypothetical protein